MTRPPSVDGVIRTGLPQQPITHKIPSPSVRINSSPNQAQSPVQRQFAKPAPQKPSRWQRWQMPLILLGGMIGGFLVQTTWIGVAMIVIYGVFAMILRIPSRTTFALAALSVVAITVMLLFKPNEQLASNFTTYTFLLLVIGVIALIIEGRPPKRRKRSRRVLG
ncbi:MAG TPA: hypothetical protein VLA92_02505 [Candidatus Saccharimonadales bacterium]|nr:hypothetical protein [Candidatus Saccharimonadales bacterium]